jgi:hypothetical protein
LKKEVENDEGVGSIITPFYQGRRMRGGWVLLAIVAQDGIQSVHYMLTLQYDPCRYGLQNSENTKLGIFIY